MTSTRSAVVDFINPMTKSFLEDSDDSDEDLGNLTFSQEDKSDNPKTETTTAAAVAGITVLDEKPQPQSPSLAATKGTNSKTTESPFIRTTRTEEEQALQLSKHVNCRMKHLHSVDLLGWRKVKQTYYPVEICPNQEQGQFLVELTDKKDTLIRYLGCYASHARNLEPVPRSVILPVEQKEHETTNNDEPSPSNQHNSQAPKWNPSFLESYLKVLSKRSEFQQEPAKVKAEQMILERMLQSVWKNQQQPQAPTAIQSTEISHSDAVEQDADENASTTSQDPEIHDNPTEPQSQHLSSPTGSTASSSSSSSFKRFKNASKRPARSTSQQQSTMATSTAVTTFKNLKLRAGDVIQYHKLEGVASRENLLTATITAVYPAPHYVALSLDNGQVIPRGSLIQILLVKRVLRGLLVDVEHRQWKDLEDYGLDKSYNDKVFDHARKRNIGHVYAEMRQEMQQDEEQFWQDTNADFASNPSTAKNAPKVWPIRMPSKEDLESLLEQVEQSKSKRRTNMEVVAIQEDHLKTCQSVWKVLRHLFTTQQEQNDMNVFLDDLIQHELNDTDLDHEWNFLDGNKNNLWKVQKLETATRQWKKWLKQHTDLLGELSSDKKAKTEPTIKQASSDRGLSKTSGIVDGGISDKNLEQSPSSTAHSIRQTKPVVTDERKPTMATKRKTKSASLPTPRQSSSRQAITSKKRRRSDQSDKVDRTVPPASTDDDQAPTKKRRASDPGTNSQTKPAEKLDHGLQDDDRIPPKNSLDKRLANIRNKRRRSADTEVEEAYLQTLLRALSFTIGLARESKVSSLDTIVRLLEPVFDQDITVENLWQFLDGNKNKLLRTDRLKEMTAEWERVMAKADREAVIKQAKAA